MKTQNREIAKALAKGNFVRALSLKGYKCSLRESRVAGRMVLDLAVRSAHGFEGYFNSASDAWGVLCKS